jgi:hypothetical protein
VAPTFLASTNLTPAPELAEGWLCFCSSDKSGLRSPERINEILPRLSFSGSYRLWPAHIRRHRHCLAVSIPEDFRELVADSPCTIANIPPRIPPPWRFLCLVWYASLPSIALSYSS